MGMVKGFVIVFILFWRQKIWLQDPREGHICKVVAAFGAMSKLVCTADAGTDHPSRLAGSMNKNMFG